MRRFTAQALGAMWRVVNHMWLDRQEFDQGADQYWKTFSFKIESHSWSATFPHKGT